MFGVRHSCRRQPGGVLIQPPAARECADGHDFCINVAKYTPTGNTPFKQRLMMMTTTTTTISVNSRLRARGGGRICGGKFDAFFNNFFILGIFLGGIWDSGGGDFPQDIAGNNTGRRCN